MLARRPIRPTSQTATVPAPYGINIVDTASSLPATDAVALVNMIRGQYGLRSRSGYREWVTGIGEEVRTLLSFQGGLAANDKLFACSQTGIWDATSSTTTPATSHAWGTADANSGRCIGYGFTKLDGTHVLTVCDETNGYTYYTESSGLWTTPVAGAGAGEVDGVDPADLVFVLAWKHRLWFVKRDSSLAYYLPVDQITGTVAPFDFGPQFRKGGFLVGLWSWTGDGGAGIDDHLVAISSAGDVVIYGGTDPDTVGGFGVVGVWSVGAVPVGRRIATDNGGDLLILSALGVLPVSRLPTGGSLVIEDAYASRKIGPVLGQELTDRGSDLGWDLRIHPEDKTLVITTPDEGGLYREQWALSLNGNGWAQHIGVPMNCLEAWKGKLYFGTEDGRVCINDGDVDNNQLAGSANSVAIEWSGLSAFSDLGTAEWKVGKMARPKFMTDGTDPQWTVEARYDFDRHEIGTVPFVAGTGTVGVWDVGIWDVSVWGSGVGTAGYWRGLSGMGSAMALAWKGSSQSRTTLVGFGVMFEASSGAL